MTAQIVASVLVTAALCAVIAYVLLARQAARHGDDRAGLLRGQLDARRAGQASAWAQADDAWPGPDWWDREFDGIAAGYGNDEGTGQP